MAEKLRATRIVTSENASLNKHSFQRNAASPSQLRARVISISKEIKAPRKEPTIAAPPRQRSGLLAAASAFIAIAITALLSFISPAPSQAQNTVLGNDSNKPKTEYADSRAAPSALTENKAPVYDTARPCAGVQRIAIEVPDGKIAQPYSQSYGVLVDTISGILQDYDKLSPLLQKAGKGDTGAQQALVQRVWYVLNEKIHMQVTDDGGIYLWQSVKGIVDAKSILRGTLIMDCDNSAFLVFDVLSRLGVNAEIVSVGSKLGPAHALVKVGEIAFETRDGKSYAASDIPSHYDYVFGSTSDPAKMQGLTYSNMAINQTDADSAVKRAKLAILANPQDASFHYSLGLIYYKAGEYKHAIASLQAALAIIDDYAPAKYYLAKAENELKRHSGVKGIFRSKKPHE